MARRPRALLLAICLFAALMRLNYLGVESLWLDETSTWRVVHSSAANFYPALVRTEVAPPFYYLILFGWTRLAGESEVALRLPSALAGILTVAALGVLGRRLLGQRAGLIAALLLAASPRHIWYSQEARTYAVYTLLAVLATLVLARALRRGGRGAWLAYCGLMLLLCYTHYFSAFFAAAHGLLAARQAWARRRFAAGLAPWLACMAGVAALWLFWVPSLFRTPWGNGGWIAERQAGMSLGAQLWLPVNELVFGGVTLGPGLMPAAIYTLVGALVVWGLARRGRDEAAEGGLAVILTLAAVPLLMAWGVTQVTPSLVPRYVLPVLPFMLALVARGAARFRSRAAAALVAGALVAGELWVVKVNHTYPLRPDWRGLTAYVKEHSQPGDAIAAYEAFYRLPLQYYMLGDDIRVLPSLGDYDGAGRLWLINVWGNANRGIDDLAARYTAEAMPHFYHLRTLTLYQVEEGGQD